MKKIMPFIYILILVLFDQIVKILALIKLKPLESVMVIKDFFYLTYVENKGAAFGIFEGARWIFILIALVAVVFCIIYYNKVSNTRFLILCKIALIFIASGAMGNMIDRIFRKYVIDMFHFVFLGKDFAVFNIADILVCVGTFLFGIYIIFSDKQEK